MGTKLLESGGVRLINQSVVLWIWSFRLKDGVSFRCLLSKVIFFVLSTLYIKHCPLILPLFVAICVILLSGFTYGVYVVLFLKPGAIAT